MKHCVYIMTLALLLVAGTHTARGEGFTLPTVETSMTSAIFSTLAADFAFRPMEPASDLGNIWGAYFGFGASGTSTSLVSGIFNNLPNSYVPNAQLEFGIGLPRGFTLEFAALPTLTYSGSSIGEYAGALKWTLTQSAIKFPISLALQAEYAKSSLSFNEALSGGTVSVSYKNSVFGGNLIASKWLGIFGFGIEPYVGFGVLDQSSSLSGTGTSSLFGSSFPAGTTSFSDGGVTTWLQAGMMLKLALMAFTAEYDKFFGLSSYSFKFSVRF